MSVTHQTHIHTHAPKAKVIETTATFDGTCYQEDGDNPVFTTDLGVHDRVFGGTENFPRRVRITITPITD